jgi:hypothetical protein
MDEVSKSSNAGSSDSEPATVHRDIYANEHHFPGDVFDSDSAGESRQADDQADDGDQES